MRRVSGLTAHVSSKLLINNGDEYLSTMEMNISGETLLLGEEQLMEAWLLRGISGLKRGFES